MYLRCSPAFVPIVALLAMGVAACDSATTSSVTTRPTPSKCQLTLAQPALGYGAALTVAATPRFTVIGELLGRRVEGLGRLGSTTAPHPRLIGVDTIRLTGIEETTDRIVAVGGVKWNMSSTWLFTANVLRPLTDVGLNATWIPTITFDYSFGG